MGIPRIPHPTHFCYSGFKQPHKNGIIELRVIVVELRERRNKGIWQVNLCNCVVILVIVLVIRRKKVPHFLMKETPVLMQGLSDSLEEMPHVIDVNFIQPRQRKARLHYLISAVMFLQYLKDFFVRGRY